MRSAQRALDRLHQVLVGVVEVRPVGHDPRLGLDRDLLALGGGQLHRLGEALLAAVGGASVDVGVVEEVDPGIAGRAHQGADLLVGLLGDAHQSEHHVRCGDVGVRQGELLHGVASARSGEGQGDGAQGLPCPSASKAPLNQPVRDAQWEARQARSEQRIRAIRAAQRASDPKPLIGPPARPDGPQDPRGLTACRAARPDGWDSGARRAGPV